MNFLSVMGGGKTLGLACAVATAAFAASATEWKYYAAGAEGNPTTVDCITDGNWVLRVTNSSLPASGTLVVGNGDPCVKAGSGVLDMREVTIDGTVYSLSFGAFAFNNSSTITEFYADNVTSLGAQKTFNVSQGLTTVSISGTFDVVCPSCFNYCTSLTNVVLNSKALKTISSSAFQESKKLTAIEITSDLELTVNNTAVQYNNPLTSLTINGPAWETTNVDNLLTRNTASDTTKQCTIYANSENWASLAATLTDAETAVKPKKCFGVYREGSRKAWLVANNEKRGFAIIVR